MAGRFPKILIDEDRNAPNSMRYPLTVEEYYDLMHHSHENINNPGGGTGSDEATTNIIKRLEALEETCKQQAETIESMQKDLNQTKSTVNSIPDVEQLTQTNQRLQQVEETVQNTIIVTNLEEVTDSESGDDNGDTSLDDGTNDTEITP